MGLTSRWRLKYLHVMLKVAIFLTLYWNGAMGEKQVHSILKDNTLAALASSSAMCELLRFPDAQNSKLAFELLPGDERSGLRRERGKGDSQFVQACDSLTNRQVSALTCPSNSTQYAFVYLWCSNISRYIGKANWTRLAPETFGSG